VHHLIPVAAERGEKIRVAATVRCQSAELQLADRSYLLTQSRLHRCRWEATIDTAAMPLGNLSWQLVIDDVVAAEGSMLLVESQTASRVRP
jgi:hypothetical protein